MVITLVCFSEHDCEGLKCEVLNVNITYLHIYIFESINTAFSFLHFLILKKQVDERFQYSNVSV